MGKRGPTPQPKAIAEQKGLYRPSRHEDQIAEINSLRWVYNELPMPPDDLGPVASEVWTSILADAQKIKGYISTIDLRLFKEYCYLYGEMEFLKGETDGVRTYKDDNGVVRVNPLYTELNKIRKDFIRLSQEFGFSPSARTRIKLASEREEEIEDSYEL